MRSGSAIKNAKPVFRSLRVGHDPRDPAEATLALAAAAALNGLRADGTPMPNGECGHPPSLRDIAREIGLCIGAVRRGIRHLQAAGDVSLQADGVHVEPHALQRRWQSHRQRLRLDGVLRQLGLRAQPLLLAALVAGQIDKQGGLRLGVEFLAERTGLARRTVERALATARKAGAIHTWSVPIDGGGHRRQLFLAPGTSSGSRSAGDTCPQAKEEVVASGRPARSQSGGRTGREEAVRWSQSGGRHPDCPPEVPPDSPPDALSRDLDLQTPAAPAGETREGRREPRERQDPVDGLLVRQIVEGWVLAYAKKGVHRLEEQHAVEVAGLLRQIGPDHDIRDRDARRAAVRSSAARAERLELARRVIRWCPSPERLGRWLVRALTEFNVTNLGAYLRESCSHGDPGQLLESHAKNSLGRGSETRQDFSPSIEKALQGDRHPDVQALVAGVAVTLSADDEDRQRLREQLRQMLQQGRDAAARAVLLQLVGGDQSDIGITRAIGDACSLTKARELLAA